jgi:hypothetical protein
MTIRASLPEGIKAYVTPDTTATPLIENSQVAEDKIGTGLASANISDTDSVMPITHVMGGKLTATGTIDFSNGTDPTTGVAGVDATGKRLLWIEIYVDPATAAAVNVAPGAANPYPLFGAANDFDLPPGVAMIVNQRKESDGTAPAARFPAVAGAVKTLDVTITGAGTVYWHAGFGD